MLVGLIAIHRHQVSSNQVQWKLLCIYLAASSCSKINYTKLDIRYSNSRRLSKQPMAFYNSDGSVHFGKEVNFYFWRKSISSCNFYFYCSYSITFSKTLLHFNFIYLCHLSCFRYICSKYSIIDPLWSIIIYFDSFWFALILMILNGIFEWIDLEWLEINYFQWLKWLKWLKWSKWSNYRSSSWSVLILSSSSHHLVEISPWQYSNAIFEVVLPCSKHISYERITIIFNELRRRVWFFFK